MAVQAVRKKPSLIEQLRLYPEHGVGTRVKRVSWRTGVECTVHSIRPQRDGKHGRVWGVKQIDGCPVSSVHELHSPNKRGVWRIVSQRIEQSPH